MRSSHIFVGSIVAMIAVVVFVPSGRGDEPKPATEPVKSERELALEKRVGDLVKQNADLREEVAKLKAEARRSLSGTVVIPRIRELKVETSTPQSAVPDHWIKREFNGEPYYLIPLKAGR